VWHAHARDTHPSLENRHCQTSLEIVVRGVSVMKAAKVRDSDQDLRRNRILKSAPSEVRATVAGLR